MKSFSFASVQLYSTNSTSLKISHDHGNKESSLGRIFKGLSRILAGWDARRRMMRRLTCRNTWRCPRRRWKEKCRWPSIWVPFCFLGQTSNQLHWTLHEKGTTHQPLCRKGSRELTSETTGTKEWEQGNGIK